MICVVRSSYHGNHYCHIVPSYLSNNCESRGDTCEDGKESGDNKKPGDYADKRTMVFRCLPQWSVRGCQIGDGAHGVRRRFASGTWTIAKYSCCLAANSRQRTHDSPILHVCCGWGSCRGVGVGRTVGESKTKVEASILSLRSWSSFNFCARRMLNNDNIHSKNYRSTPG